MRPTWVFLLPPPVALKRINRQRGMGVLKEIELFAQRGHQKPRKSSTKYICSPFRLYPFTPVRLTSYTEDTELHKLTRDFPPRNISYSTHYKTCRKHQTCYRRMNEASPSSNLQRPYMKYVNNRIERKHHIRFQTTNNRGMFPCLFLLPISPNPRTICAPRDVKHLL